MRLPSSLSTCLILRNASVDLVAPRQNAAPHVLHLAEAGLTKEVARLAAADSALAMCDDLDGAVELIDPLGQIAQRDQLRSGDLADLILVRLAYIDQQEVVAAILLGLHLD